MRLPIFTLLVLVQVTAGAAPPAATVSDADIEDAKKLLRMPTEADIDAVRRSLAPLQAKDPARARSPAAPAVVDPAALSAQMTSFSNALAGQMLSSKNQPALLLFVSLSMPRASLVAYAEQAERAQATVVIRGVQERSMMKTLQLVREVIGERKVAWAIDPTVFDRFDVQTVPAVVLTAASLAGASCSTRECTAPDSFAKVTGEVPIDHSLREIQRRVPALQTAASTYLKRFASPW